MRKVEEELREVFNKYPSASSGTTLRQAQGPPFDKLRDHPSASSGTTLRQAQGPPFGKLRDHPSTSSGTTLRQEEEPKFLRIESGVWNLTSVD